MKIIAIFEIIENCLYAVQFSNEDKDEFSCLFEDRWQDLEYLDFFFEKNSRDLLSGFFGNISIEDAIDKTIESALEFKIILYNRATDGILNDDESLQTLFKPLEKSSNDIEYEKQKAYGPGSKSWLRVYAIRISLNKFVISGGAIKLTKKMDREHLQLELKKLEITQKYLKDNFGLECSDIYTADLPRS